MTTGIYRGRREEDPGKMKYRHKGSFVSETVARAHQQKHSKEGKRAKIVHYPGDTHPYHLYVVAPHNFWKRNFIIDGRK